MIVKVLFVLLLAQLAHCTGYSNGFGDAYNWTSTPDKSIAEGKRAGKPVMVIIHASWCGWSRKLKNKFAPSKEIQELSKDFVLVNAMDDDEPNDDAYAPDGYYYPRIIFICKGKVMDEIKNASRATSKYKYVYGEVEDIAVSMRKALTNCV